MSRRSKATEQGTAEDVELHYTITPRLSSSLGHARWVAGRASVLGLSFYGLRALQTEIMHLRIAEMTVGHGKGTGSARICVWALSQPPSGS